MRDTAVKVTIRHSDVGDRETLASLAMLDSTGTPPEPALVAELDGKAVAAVSLSDGSVAADPFVATAEIVELLRLRARQAVLRSDELGSRRGRIPVLARHLPGPA